MKRLCSLLLIAMLLLTLCAPAMAARNQEAMRQSVVRVYQRYECVFYDENENLVGTGYSVSTGSAVAVGKKGQPVECFVTNRHVVETEPYATYLDDGTPVVVYPISEPELMVIFDELGGNQKSVYVEVKSDREDLALIKMNGPTDLRVPAILREPKPGELDSSTEVWSCGFPGVGDALEALGEKYPSLPNQASMSHGYISKCYDSEEGYILQHNATISGGDSGGALTDKNGYLLGINYSGYDVNGGAINNAISTSDVIRLLDSENVPYETTTEFSQYLIYGAIGLVVAAVVAVVIVIVRRGAGSGRGKTSAGNNRVLVGEEGALKGRQFTLKSRMCMGRDPGACSIAFPDETKGISRLHCTIVFDGKQVLVTDENSRYGTWIDSTKLRPGTPMPMHRGQRLYLGSRQQCLRLGSSN